MENEKKNKEVHTSRKWIVTIWAMIIGTVIVLFCGVSSIMGNNIPDGFIGLATLSISTAIAYIGGNVWQKNIDHKETR